MEKLNTAPVSRKTHRPSGPRAAAHLIPLLLSFAYAPFLLEAAFDNGAWGVRAAGMGGAFVAQSNDGSAPFWNPAGSAFMERVQGSFMWERAYPGLTEVDIRSGYLSLLVPTKVGAMGGAVTSYNYGSLMSENIVLLHYGRRMTPPLGLGINVKYLTHDYRMGRDPAFASNPVFANGTSAGNATFDLGLLYQALHPRLSFGLAARNVTEPDVGLRATDRVPSEFAGGLAWTPGWVRENRWTFECDLAYKNMAGEPFNSKMEALLGGEYRAWKTDRFGVIARMGLNRDFAADQTKAFKNVTAGFTLESDLQNWLTLALDYAFLLNISMADGPSQINQAGTHQIGLAFFFGGPGIGGAPTASALPDNTSSKAAPKSWKKKTSQASDSNPARLDRGGAR